MNNFKKGDILIGTNRKFEGAYHPVIFIDGPDEAPLAVILTHSDKYKCNFKLSGNYGEEKSHFTAHLVQKMPEWGPYKKIGELAQEDINLIESHISGTAPITWEEYKEYTSNGLSCPIHSPIKS